jgi:hypothetical protein
LHSSLDGRVVDLLGIGVEAVVELVHSGDDIHDARRIMGKENGGLFVLLNISIVSGIAHTEDITHLKNRDQIANDLPVFIIQFKLPQLQ